MHGQTDGFTHAFIIAHLMVFKAINMSSTILSLSLSLK